MVIVDTCIHKYVNKILLHAFLYGQIHGTYKLYTNEDTHTVAICFASDEDGTVFKLKKLDEIYTSQFEHQDQSTKRNDLLALQMKYRKY